MARGNAELMNIEHRTPYVGLRSEKKEETAQSEHRRRVSTTVPDRLLFAHRLWALAR
jgi:hypothetical protein